jgi:hypothetical protein
LILRVLAREELNLAGHLVQMAVHSSICASTCFLCSSRSSHRRFSVPSPSRLRSTNSRICLMDMPVFFRHVIRRSIPDLRRCSGVFRSGYAGRWAGALPFHKTKHRRTDMHLFRYLMDGVLHIYTSFTPPRLT